MMFSLQWRHDERHGVSNHRHLDCAQPFVQALSEEKKSKLLAFVREIHSDRWIPLT